MDILIAFLLVKLLLMIINMLFHLPNITCIFENMLDSFMSRIFTKIMMIIYPNFSLMVLL